MMSHARTFFFFNDLNMLLRKHCFGKYKKLLLHFFFFLTLFEWKHMYCCLAGVALPMNCCLKWNPLFAYAGLLSGKVKSSALPIFYSLCMQAKFSSVAWLFLWKFCFPWTYPWFLSTFRATATTLARKKKQSVVSIWESARWLETSAG